MGQVKTVYAGAIFELAKEENILEETYKEFEALYEAFKAERKLLDIFKTPVIPSSEKKEILENLFKDKISNQTLNFLKLMVDKGRMQDFLGVSESFFELYREESDIILAEVYTIEELSNDIELALIEKISKLTGKNIKIKKVIDKEIIGGIKIKIGSKILDSSVLYKLNKIGESLREVSL